MKYSVTPIYIALLLFASIYVSCKKEKTVTTVVTPPSPPPLSPHTIKARIIEYGTNLPLVDATVDVVAVPSVTLPGTMIFEPTDINGEYSFLGNRVAFREFSKTGYWNTTLYQGLGRIQFSPILLFPTPIPIDYSSYTYGSHLCDSFVVKLFPKKYITIHIVDSLGLNTCTDDCDVIFGVNGLFTEEGIDHTTYYNFADGDNVIKLRPNIDTTFQYPVFGNANNQFNIGQYERDWGTISKFFFTDTVFIANNSNHILNIAF